VYIENAWMGEIERMEQVLKVLQAGTNAFVINDIPMLIT